MVDNMNNYKEEDMSYLEKVFYETRPFFYGLIGLYALAHYSNKIALVCGFTLLYCCSFVMNRRFVYRNKMARTRVTLPSQPKKNTPDIHQIN